MKKRATGLGPNQLVLPAAYLPAHGAQGGFQTEDHAPFSQNIAMPSLCALPYCTAQKPTSRKPHSIEDTFVDPVPKNTPFAARVTDGRAYCATVTSIPLGRFAG
ncbi:hypothetical protein [Ruegeria arenilitoris]|uniref:hypothetical protein n=1 Tax=Ruegeria arenilitoris TaxID=1173585 RepID=UPI00147B29A6|nr:hypothetical protein [Ruegeria arenilitoris]